MANTIISSIKAKALLVIGISLVLMSSAYGETTLGRWCDKMVPNMPKFDHIMAIVITDDDKVVIRSNFADGSSGTSQLRELSGGIYGELDSNTGDKYRIVPNTGNLQLLDNDGLIRVASRLENTPRSGECFK